MNNRFIKWTFIFLLVIYGKDVFSQDYPRFRQQTISIKGRIHDVLVLDLNGDGTLDILVLHNHTEFPDPHIDRMVSVFLQDSEGLPDQPTQTLTANQGEILFDIGDLDGDGLQELIFLRENDTAIRKFIHGRFTETLQPLLNASSVFLPHDPSLLSRYRFIRDLDGDERPEIFLPQRHELHIYSRNPEGKYERIQRLWAAPEFTLIPQQEFTQALHLPRLELQDYNGDALQDIFLLFRDRCDVFLQRSPMPSGPRISLTPPDLRYRMGSRSVSPSVFDPLTPVPSTLNLKDLNGDGYADIILTRGSRASFTHRISQIQVFLNRGGRYDILPDHVFAAENFGGEHDIRDFNDDGLQDFALLTFKIGFSQALKFLITKKAGNSFDFYSMQADHSYQKKPKRKIAFSRKIKIGELLGSKLCHSFDGDFNGDGIPDLLIGTDSEELSIYTGSTDTFFDKKPALKIHATPSSSIWTGDLNRDGFSDIILWYPLDPNLGRQFILIRSKREPSP